MRDVRTENSCVLKVGQRLSLKIRSFIFIQKTTFREINYFSVHPVDTISPKEPFLRTVLWGTQISISICKCQYRENLSASVIN